mmetsp:Transcript_10712/g.30421  ORF Transcript_10712/g.30421 Transcript_10712/m.30421 type:complete len:902 (-) Transcript_10712:501-3206(-)|eukprot:CAMPEP_0117663410 /NCGR_PEP_ID=MMETSP0804-20121206/8591_1 /TAXON_ID=1074897 /ORGANISM="Tetraselmis astigmatica, Strain CCMP880" /LENGTH=901 /DNA_ID=CAMNT_0005470413 /DNA_START=98 /DNA_END=2803 /DNA_ORIENTATION=+
MAAQRGRLGGPALTANRAGKGADGPLVPQAGEMTNYSQLQDYPALRCHPQFNLRVLAAVDPSHPAVLRAWGGSVEAAAAGLAACDTTIHVDWGDSKQAAAGSEAACCNAANDDDYECCSSHCDREVEPAELVILRLPGGEVVASASTHRGAPLAVTFQAAPHCASFLARLTCGAPAAPALSRHLHLYAPPTKRNTSHLTLTVDPAVMLAPATALPSAEVLLADLLRLPPLCPSRPSATRGVGLELELLTLDPHRSGFGTKREELHAVLEELERTATAEVRLVVAALAGGVLAATSADVRATSLNSSCSVLPTESESCRLAGPPVLPVGLGKTREPSPEAGAALNGSSHPVCTIQYGLPPPSRPPTSCRDADVPLSGVAAVAAVAEASHVNGNCHGVGCVIDGLPAEMPWTPTSVTATTVLVAATAASAADVALKCPDGVFLAVEEASLAETDDVKPVALAVVLAASTPDCLQGSCVVCVADDGPRQTVSDSREALPSREAAISKDAGGAAEDRARSLSPEAAAARVKTAAVAAAAVVAAAVTVAGTRQLAAADLPHVDRVLTPESIAAVCARLRRWIVSVDSSVCGFTPHTASELALAHGQSAAALSEMARERGTYGMEFKSPPPPFELRIGGSDSALSVAEVTVMFRLLRHLGVAAPDTGERGSIAGLHCHVNVANPQGAGSLLSHRAVLAVWQAWVVYNLVTTQMSRSWRWRDRFAAPLFATGAEYSFEQKPWEQGLVLGCPRPLAGDVPAFVRRCHALVRSERFAACTDEAERLAMVFAKGEGPGKMVSLNLDCVTTFGTIEFRQMAATTDEAAVLRWANFCAAFVEVFSSEAEGVRAFGSGTGAAPEWSHILDAPDAEAAIGRLQTAQAAATLGMLEADMGLSPGYLSAMMMEAACT